MLVVESIATHIHDGIERKLAVFSSWRYTRCSAKHLVRMLIKQLSPSSDLQPIDLPVMCEAELKLINDSINSNCPTGELELRIIRIIENEVVPIEIRQMLSSNTAGDGRYMIDIWLLYHRGHSLLHCALAKLEFGVLVPYSFEIEVWTTYQRFEKCQASSVSDCCRRASEVIVSWDREERVHVGIFV